MLCREKHGTISKRHSLYNTFLREFRTVFRTAGYVADREIHRYTKIVNPIINVDTSACMTVNNASVNLSIDEAMITFKGTGTSAIKQYMPKKPKKHGSKDWVRSDSTNGFYLPV